MASIDGTRRVPAVVVSGFLGAGKTTLVRWLLRDAQARGRRAAVVSNEFGALGIDRALLSEGAEAIVELEGGCVCCQLSNDLLETIVRLRERVDPDLFIVETSGLALASETLLTFWRDPVRDWISDNLGVVVVNAEQVHQRRDLDGAFIDQLGAADLIVVNKLDLVPTEARRDVEQTLRTIEPDAPIVWTSHGEIDPVVLFPPEPTARAKPAIPAARHEHHHERFVAEVCDFSPGLVTAEIIARLRALEPLRAKGFIDSDDAIQLIEMVGSRVHLARPPFAPPAELVGKVVVIRRAT